MRGAGARTTHAAQGAVEGTASAAVVALMHNQMAIVSNLIVGLPEAFR